MTGCQHQLLFKRMERGEYQTYLQRILSGEALVAVRAWERLHRQVYPLVSLEIVVPVEGLRALVAFEWSLVRRRLAVIAVHLRRMAARHVARVQRRVHALPGHAHHGHAIGMAMHVGENGTAQRGVSLRATAQSRKRVSTTASHGPVAVWRLGIGRKVAGLWGKGGDAGVGQRSAHGTLLQWRAVDIVGRKCGLRRR